MDRRHTGLRMGELLALRWRDVDFPRQAIHVRASFAKDIESTPKSGAPRTVPMVDDVARELAQLGGREVFTGLSDLVFCGPTAGHLDSNRVRRRYRERWLPRACRRCASTSSATRSGFATQGASGGSGRVVCI